MNRQAAIGLILTFVSIAVIAAEPLAKRSGAEIYAVNSCGSCHGTRLQGVQGPSLLGPAYLHGTADEMVARSIRDGYPDKGMPPWGGAISQPEIQSLVDFLKAQRAENTPEHLAQLDEAQKRAIPAAPVSSELHRFRAQIVAEPGKPWGMAFLPDGRLLVTEERGGLRIIANGRLLPEAVRNTPHGQPVDFFKRVLLDVAVHPDYKRNGWIYLTCGDSVKGPDGTLTNEVNLVRGRLRGNAWVDSQTLVHLPIDTATARIAFDNGNRIYISTSSEAGVNEAKGREPLSLEQLLDTAPQNLKDLTGKILRYRDDGSIPDDNPFAGNSGARAEIWSYGHRNPQGLAFDPHTGLLWSSEHGPRGGDELNLILAGHNYGWPVISYGTRYDGITFTTETAREGMDQPVMNWTPSIAVAPIAFYEGVAFPKWKHNLFIGSLKQQELFRVVLHGERAVVQESILKDYGRIRSIAIGPEGDIYLALELRLQGLIVRLVP